MSSWRENPPYAGRRTADAEYGSGVVGRIMVTFYGWSLYFRTGVFFGESAFLEGGLLIKFPLPVCLWLSD